MCCLLFAVCCDDCLLRVRFVVYCLLFGLLFVVIFPFFSVGWLLCVVCCWQTGDCCLLYIGCTSLFVVCCVLLAVSSCVLFAMCRL